MDFQMQVLSELKKMNGRLGGIDGRLDAVDRRLDASDSRHDAHESRFDRIDATLFAMQTYMQEELATKSELRQVKEELLGHIDGQRHP